MEGALLALFTPSVLVFGVVVWMATLFFRKVIEALALKIAHIFPDKYEPWWQEAWREWVLPAAPIIFGGLAVLLFPTYPFPEMFETTDSKVFLGVVLGGASGYVYRWAKFQFMKYMPEKMKELDKKLSLSPPLIEGDEEDDNKEE